jgi:hypothetical protein
VSSACGRLKNEGAGAGGWLTIDALPDVLSVVGCCWFPAAAVLIRLLDELLLLQLEARNRTGRAVGGGAGRRMKRGTGAAGDGACGVAGWD